MTQRRKSKSRELSCTQYVCNRIAHGRTLRQGQAVCTVKADVESRRMSKEDMTDSNLGTFPRAYHVQTKGHACIMYHVCRQTAGVLPGLIARCWTSGSMAGAVVNGHNVRRRRRRRRASVGLEGGG